MGDFTEMVHGYDNKKMIKLEFVVGYSNENLNETITTYWSSDKIRNLPFLQELNAKSNYYNLNIKKVRKYELDFSYNPEMDPNKDTKSPDLVNKILDTVAEIFKDKRIDKSQGEVTNEDSGKDRGKEIAIKRFSNIKNKINFKFSNLNELNKLIRDEGNYSLQVIETEISRLFSKFDETANYISSFRLFPERTYYETSKNDLKVGKFGENYEDQIIQWEANKDPKYKELSNILIELGLLSEMKSNRLAGGRFEILVKNKTNGTWSTISDVGFGISQFLPIIVADVQLGKGSTLYIAQPEIHLHPKIQAQFADYIVKRIINDEKLYVIETHSEYLINRLRLAIVEKKISKEDVKTYFIENDGNKASYHELDFLENGQIMNAPNTFFDTYMLDVMNIAINAE